MTISILNDLLLLRDKPITEWYSYLERINVHTFDAVLKEYHSAKYNSEQIAKNVILFILCAYDEYSPMVVGRQARPEELNNICEYLNVPEYQRQQLIFNEDPIVRFAITDYLRTFAGDIFRNYMFLKMQLMDFELMITNKSYGGGEELREKDKEGAEKITYVYTYDIKEHSKAVTQTRLLSKEIAELEKQLKLGSKLPALTDMANWKPKNYVKPTGNRGNIESLVNGTHRENN